MTTSSGLLPEILDGVISALRRKAPLRVMRDGRDRAHVVVDPPATRAELISWLFEGRRNPPPLRIFPDPLVGAADAPHRRFAFRPTLDEFVQTRTDFRRRWLDGGVGSVLDRQLPDWLP